MDGIIECRELRNLFRWQRFRKSFDTDLAWSDYSCYRLHSGCLREDVDKDVIMQINDQITHTRNKHNDDSHYNSLSWTFLHVVPTQSVDA